MLSNFARNFILQIAPKSLLLASLLLACLASIRPAAAQEIFFNPGSSWKFFRGVTAPSTPDPTAWRTQGFDDTAWESGPTGIGYGDGDDATVLDDMMGRYLTVYTRKTFTVTPAQLAAATTLLLSIDYDDGFVCFLNGIEVARAQAGAVGTELAFDTPAAANREAGNVAYLDLTPSLGSLIAGDNLIACEVHNSGINSSDLSFNARLSANDPRVSCPTGLGCAKTTQMVTLTWTNSPLVLYDAIQVRRDGAVLANLPGDAVTYQDIAPGDFNNRYEVVASVAGVSCDPLVCATDPQFTLVANNATWRFLRGSAAPSDPPAAWRELIFDDSLWETGRTGIGYGDGDDTTVLLDMQQRGDDPATPENEAQPGYLSVFCRRAFAVGDPTVFKNLILDVNYDDGFIAYLNGVEVARSASMGAPGTEFAFDQPAQAGHEITTNPERFDITAAIPLLVPDQTNVLAVQVHNNPITSSDLSFVPTLLANTCVSGLTCTFNAAANRVTLAWASVPADSISVTRNGTPLPGSPFAGDVTTAIDASPSANDNVYEVIATIGGFACPPLTCTVDCADRDPDALTCLLSVVNGMTQAQLAWTTPPGTASIEVRREGTLVATLAPAASGYTDPDVEAEMPEDDTDFTVRFDFTAGGSCTISCLSVPLCPGNFTCTPVDAGGVQRARLTWDNVVKEWTSFSIQRNGIEIASGLPGTSTSYTDSTIALVEGEPHTYTLIPVAPPGEEVGTACNRTCTVALQVPELADYQPPAGGWDYRIDFNAPDQARYDPLQGSAGNLDGAWIRAVGFDVWDGSAPLATGPAPGGPAPGGIGIETLAGSGPCKESTGVLRILNPGDTTNPAGTSLATEFPEPFSEPNNRIIFLGLDTGVIDRNLLRDGVTFSARWRINPAAPAYLAATAGGDGSPITGGMGQVGIYFRNDGSLANTGSSAALSFSLNSGKVLQMSTNPLSSLAGFDIDRFNSIWVTVRDPEADGTYETALYLNGKTTPFPFLGTSPGAALQGAALAAGGVPYFGPAGNYLAIGIPIAGNDADLQIDYIAYKAGVHAPAAKNCDGGPGPIQFRRGDTDTNGAVEITDPINLLGFLFLGDPQPPCFDSSDVDDNGALEITDAIASLGFQFLGEAPPPPPGPLTCGPDPTPEPPGADYGCVYASCPQQ